MSYYQFARQPTYSHFHSRISRLLIHVVHIFAIYLEVIDKEH